MNPLNLLLPYQRRWVADKSRFKIGLWSRQTGKSTACAAEVVIDCLSQPNRQWIILSAGERQAQEFMKKIHRWAGAMHTYLTRELQNPHFTEPTCTKGEITWPNGSRALALPANPDTARGYSANIILDEFAFYENPDALWRAIYPTITNPLAGGQKLLRIVTTPNGFNNRAHKIWTTTPHQLPQPTPQITTEAQRKFEVEDPGVASPLPTSSPSSSSGTSQPASSSLPSHNPHKPFTPQTQPKNLTHHPPKKNLRASVTSVVKKPQTWSRHLLTIHHAVQQGLPIDIQQLRAGIDDPTAWAQEYECQFLDTQNNTLLPYNIILPCEPQTEPTPETEPEITTEAQRKFEVEDPGAASPLPSPSSPSVYPSSFLGLRSSSGTSQPAEPAQPPAPGGCGSSLPSNTPHKPSTPKPNQKTPQITHKKKLRASVTSVVKTPTRKYPWQNHHQIPPPQRPQLFIGIDFARTRDYSVAWTLQRVNPDRSDPLYHPDKPLYITRDITHLSDLPTPRQAEILATRIPHARAAAIDVTGPGLGLGELLADKFGIYHPDPAQHQHGKILLCHFTPKLKHTILQRLRSLMQDRRILIPTDPVIREDLHSWQQTYTPTGESTYTSPHTLNSGHGDHTIALALALHIAEPQRPAHHTPAKLQIQTIPRPPRAAW